MRKKLPIWAVIALGLCLTPPGPSQDKWEQAEREIKRLRPSDFAELPAVVVKQLEARGCTIPQVFGTRGPHNVIQGQFARRGQTDWAVLCSKEGKSSILVLWGRPTAYPSELASREDKDFLQEIGEGRIGYSRAINAVGRDDILEQYKRYGGPKPPPLTHEGVNDAFMEKASVVHYCYRGKWIALTGAD